MLGIARWRVLIRRHDPNSASMIKGFGEMKTQAGDFYQLLLTGKDRSGTDSILL